MRHNTPRRRKAEGLRFPITIGPSRAALDAGDPAFVIHDDAVHLREIYYQAPIAHRGAGHAVAASANRRQEPAPACKPHCVYHVRSAATTRDQRGATVEHPVEDDARLVITGLAGAKEWPAHRHP